MRSKTLLIILLAILVPTAAVVAMTMAAGTVKTVGNTQESLVPNQVFTYQGELLNEDVPEPGPCDFQFGLWDELELGSQVGVTQTLSSIPLYDGRFTVQLNDSHQFGTHPFDGSSRYLAIEVDCPSGSGTYVPLSPRQPLTPAPYSYYASSAGSVPWTGISGMPDGFADGVDDDTLYEAGTGLELISTTFQLVDSYQLPQGCDPDQLIEWTGSSWGCMTPESGATEYGNVVVVAKSGGSFETIQGALDSITDADSDNRYLVWVAPGVYSETIDMKSYVDIEGAGQSLTKIQSGGASTTDEATVEAAVHSELRYLTVENTGGEVFAIAIRSDVDDFNLLGVKAVASGATSSSRGISIISSNMLNRINDSIVEVTIDGAASHSYGIRFHASTGHIDLILDNTSIDINGTGTNFSTGLYQTVNTGRTGSITATDLMVNAENLGNGAASGASAVYVTGAGARMSMSDSVLYAYGPNHSGIGFFDGNGSFALLRNAAIEGNTHGIWISSSSDPGHVEINGSMVKGGTYSVRTSGSAVNELYVGASLLDGSYDIAASSTMTCVASYDESYNNIIGYTACP